MAWWIINKPVRTPSSRQPVSRMKETLLPRLLPLASSPRLRSVFVGLTSKYGSERRAATLGARASLATPGGAGPGRRSPYKETRDTKFRRSRFLSTSVSWETPQSRAVWAGTRRDEHSLFFPARIIIYGCIIIAEPSSKLLFFFKFDVGHETADPDWLRPNISDTCFFMCVCNKNKRTYLLLLFNYLPNY